MDPANHPGGHLVMIQFERDKVGQRSNFFSKAFTDKLLDFLEALANATFSPVGIGKTHATQKNVIYEINAGSGGGGAAPCQFAPFDASDEFGPKVGLAWGTIMGRQPAGFSAGGDPPFTIPVGGIGYVYAYATFDTSTLLVIDAGIIVDTNPLIENTETTAYALICSFSLGGVDSATVQIAGSTCGPFNFDPCTLSIPTGGGSGGSGGSGGGDGTGGTGGGDGTGGTGGGDGTGDGGGDTGGGVGGGVGGDSGGGLGDSGGL